MFKPKEMSRLLIAASRDQMVPVIAELYRHNLFHIEEFVDAGQKATRALKSARLFREQAKSPLISSRYGQLRMPSRSAGMTSRR